MLTNSSLPPSTPQSSSTSTTASAYLLPSFLYVPVITLTQNSIERFARAFLLPKALHPALTTNAALSANQKLDLLQRPHLQEAFPGVRQVDELLVLICGHGARDSRCGTLGPILHAEFVDKLRDRGFDVDGGADIVEGKEGGVLRHAKVAEISHVGGHKFAGNVIIYIPPSWDHPLAGKGVWYGRVEPQSVEGLVNATVVEGKVVKDLFRGGVDKGGEVMRL